MDDKVALVDANRAYLRQWLPWLEFNTRPEHTLAFVQASLRQFAARDGLACGMRFHGALVGVAGLHRIDWANRRTSIGYWIAEAHQGHGVVTRACAGPTSSTTRSTGCWPRSGRARATGDRRQRNMHEATRKSALQTGALSEKARAEGRA